MVADIAAANAIPKKFLDAILGELRTAGFVHSKKGRGGGYALARSPDAIRVGDIVRALDGMLAPIGCASRAFYRRCDDCALDRPCGVQRVMAQARDALASVLDSAHSDRVARTRRTRRVNGGDAEARRADIALFVGRNRARLLKDYDAVARGAWPFCWPGLIAPQAWFLYRKMYLWAALVSAGPLLIAYLPPGWGYLDWGASLIGALGLKFYFAGAEPRHRDDPRRRRRRGRRAGADRARRRRVANRGGDRARLRLLGLRAVAQGSAGVQPQMTAATLVASAALLALFLWRGRTPPRLFLDALAVGLTLGAAVAVALAPFDLRANPLHFAPQTLAFLFAGLPEEGVKLLGAAAFLSRHYLARDRRDVVFAAGALALGFAALENLFYLANAGSGWAPLALERALTATPFHVFTGLAAGFAVARWPAVGRLASSAWLALAAIHGAYDFAVFAGAPGATPEAFRRAADALGLDAGVALAGAAVRGGSGGGGPRRGGGDQARRARRASRRAAGRRAGSTRARSASFAGVLLTARRRPRPRRRAARRALMLETADTVLPRRDLFAPAPLALGAHVPRRPRRRGGAHGAARRAQAGAGARGGAWRSAAAGDLGARRGGAGLARCGFEARGARLRRQADDYRAPIDAYGEALRREPSRFETLAKRARAYAALNRYDAALADLDAALRVAPDAAALYVERADINRRRNDSRRRRARSRRGAEAPARRPPNCSPCAPRRGWKPATPKAREDISRRRSSQGPRRRHRPPHLRGLATSTPAISTRLCAISTPPCTTIPPTPTALSSAAASGSTKASAERAARRLHARRRRRRPIRRCGASSPSRGSAATPRPALRRGLAARPRLARAGRADAARRPRARGGARRRRRHRASAARRISITPCRACRRTT